MASSHTSKALHLIFFQIVIFKLVATATASQDSQPTYFAVNCVNTTVNYTENGEYSRNLDTILMDLTDKSALTGFYNATSGEIPDEVYGLFYCRGDVNPQLCHDCVQYAAQQITQLCAYQKEAVIYYEECTLRYANRNIFSLREDGTGYYKADYFNVSNPVKFTQVLSRTMSELIENVAYDTSYHGFGTREADVSEGLGLYCLVQCTPDTLGLPFYRCLNISLGYTQNPCCNGGRKSFAFLQPSCQLLYDTAPFYLTPTSTTPQPAQPSDLRTDTGPVYYLIRAGIPAAIFFLLLLCAIAFYLRRRKKKNTTLGDQETSTENSLHFSLGTIQSATSNLSIENKLGEGGFGAVYLPTKVSTQFSFRHKECSGPSYEPNSPYQTNLKTVTNALVSDTRITYGYYNFTSGTTPNQVHSLAYSYCRGDVPLSTCRVCITDSATTIAQSCPNHMIKFGYSEYCSIYITNKPVYGIVQDSPRWYLTASDTVTDAAGFNASLVTLMTALQNKAAAGNSEIKYTTGKAALLGDQTLYGLVQCTPDLSSKSCVDCIQGSLSLFPDCCIQPGFKASGVKIVEPSCFVQYDITPFFGNVPVLVSPLPPPRSLPVPVNNRTTSADVQKSKKSVNPIVIVLPIVVPIILIIVVLLYVLNRRRKPGKSWVKFNKEDYKTLQSLQFSLGAMKNATNDFSDDFKRGQGGFGVVYKGVLADGEEIAVKRLSRNSGQGDGQFKNEILILAKIQHRNLVRLVGFCLHNEEMLLVYELVANGSLDHFIFDPVQSEHMLWKTRYKVIIGIARGLVYLHEESQLRIIHRDLKAANVLLDDEFNPKISDFGMARLFNIDQTQTKTARIVGTYGYMAPEYVLHGQVSMKSDVFSFGVLV